jgi:UDP-GlcNAc:undecaprenyl-phosphate GlcNAc-1-phosphate transferase
MVATLLSQRGSLTEPVAALLPFGLAFVCAIVLVNSTIRLCRRYDWVARPREDRWHSGTPCLFGGVPLWLSFVAVTVLFLPLHHRTTWIIVGAASAMSLLGFLDDVYRLRPLIKLLAQIAAATVVVSAGVVYPLRPEPAINILVSVFWIVGMTNAINLLDNMDGLAAGVSLIAVFYLTVFYLRSGDMQVVDLLVIFAGSLAAFLLFNFKPARIFMGDTGSLFVGFLLGCCSLLQATHLSGVSAFVFVPVLVLVIPVFDTFFVSVTRRLRGQPISQGGTDHSSHRLVRLGLNERGAVVLLYGLSAISGGVALLLRRVGQPYAIGLIGAWLLFLLVFGIHLFQPAEDYHSQSHELVSFTRRLFSRDILAVVLDPAALSLALYASYLLRFGASVGPELPAFLRSWPLLLAVKFVVLAACGMYRRSWWRGSRHDVFRLFQAVVFGEVLGVVALVGLYNFIGYSRLVFALDALFSFAVLVGIRYSFFYFRTLVHALRPRAEDERSVFLIGTSELTATALHYLALHNIRCAGLIDNNGGGDLGRLVWGTKVIGRVDDLDHLAASYRVDEVVIPENELVPISEADLEQLCARANLRLLKLGLYQGARTAPDGAAKNPGVGEGSNVPPRVGRPIPPAPPSRRSPAR